LKCIAIVGSAAQMAAWPHCFKGRPRWCALFGTAATMAAKVADHALRDTRPSTDSRGPARPIERAPFKLVGGWTPRGVTPVAGDERCPCVRCPRRHSQMHYYIGWYRSYRWYELKISADSQKTGSQKQCFNLLRRWRQSCDVTCDFLSLRCLRLRLLLAASDSGDKGERGEIGESPKPLPGRRRRTAIDINAHSLLALIVSTHSPLSSLFLKINAPFLFHGEWGMS
jgi:hypothetical protein